MRCYLRKFFLTLAVMLGTSFATAQESNSISDEAAPPTAPKAAAPAPKPMTPAMTADYGCTTCSDCCCSGVTWFVDLEATLLRYHRGDGVKVGNGPGESLEFGFELAPRISIGAVTCDGLGTRLRYWDYSHSNPAPEGGGSRLEVDTFNFDVEVFDCIQLSCNTTLEVSGGMRYNEFSEIVVNTGRQLSHDFSAPGILLGAEVRRTPSFGGQLYGGIRGSLLMSDMDVRDTFFGNFRRLDTVQSVLEMGGGYQYCTHIGHTLVTAKVGVEWQQWMNYSDSLDFGWNSPTDVGFGGFVLGVGAEF